MAVIKPLFLALFLAALALAAADGQRCWWAGPRVDCGYVGISQDVCESKGCCWMPVDFKGGPSADLPWCFHSNTAPSEYRLTKATTEGGGLSGSLELSKAVQKELGPDVKRARVTIEEVSVGTLRVRITDAEHRRWEIPTHLFNSSVLQGEAPPPRSGDSLHRLLVEEDPFSFQVLRRGKEGAGAGHAVFNTTGTRLVFKDQYLELTTWVDPEAVLYGAGERASEELHLRRNGLPLAVWSHDLGPTFLQQNMYGSHPFVLAMEADGTSWGALLFNSNGMDVVATEDRLSWRAIGGVIDLFIFMGPTPLAVMDQFTAVVGRPALMPYWSLGWHQCKYGYRSVWEVEEVVANYSAAKVPLEVVWTDIDHMDHWKDFTFDPVNYPLEEMQRFVAELHSNEQRWVPIVDPGIKAEEGYHAYERGSELDIFMKGADGRPYWGWVWPGPSHFPDFFHPKTKSYWQELLADHHSLVNYDGIWLDMDEVSNFCTGDICELPKGVSSTPSHAVSRSQLRDDPPWVCQLKCREAEGLNSSWRHLLNPPYQISNYLQRLPLNTKTMSVLATHHNGDLQYNTHNLYGLSEIKSTYEAIQAIKGKRPFVLSRASFTGTGAYAAHWTGDNAATWHDLAWSIPGVLNIGLFGMPMGGADICGFQGETNEELCSRWVALGAFYPFSRDHADLHSSYQELYRWPLVAETGRRVLGMRYRLLPYIYTTVKQAADTGAPCMRPLFMNFPQDSSTYHNSRQFMVGDALLVTPVLEQGASQVEGYFPPALWYSVWDKSEVVDASKGGRSVEMPAPLGSIPLHMKGGTAIAMAAGGSMTTSQAKRSPLTVVVALPSLVTEGFSSEQQGAMTVTGTMYNDDGESIEAGTSRSNFLTFTTTISFNPLNNAHEGQVALQFGRPGESAPACEACEAPQGWDWPALAAVEVWGWQRGADGARLEVLRCSGDCDKLEVVQSVPLGGTQVLADGHGVKLDLSGLELKLECSTAIRVFWGSNTAAGTAAVSTE